MSFYQGKPLTRRFRLIASSFMQSEGLAFSNVLSEAQIEQAFAQEGVSFGATEDAVFTPAVTLWAFLSQVLFKDEQRSCLAAVARVIVLLVSLKRSPCVKNSGPYCRARARLSPRVIQRLTADVARGSEAQVPERWLWHGRHVKLVDGTTLSMPDTPANQAAFPQHVAQAPGVGFPIARMVVLISLASGMLCAMEMGPYAGKQTSELAMLRKLMDQLDPGDVVLADRYYCTYFMVALLMQLGVDVVSRHHHRRKVDRRKRQRLGQGDYQVQWQRPARPDWMDDDTYQALPESLTQRQVEVKVREPGCRVKSLMVVTTLTDAQQYGLAEIGELYHQRWLVELDLRSLKVTLGMDVLRCQTPHMVANETWTCLLAYNLIRRSMLQAAARSQWSPRQLSFTSALQTIGASWLTLVTSSDPARLVDVQLDGLAQQRVGNRPHRVEPRAVKRRPKPHKLLNQSRAAARAELRAAAAE